MAPAHAGDRIPLIGTNPTAPLIRPSMRVLGGQIVPLDTAEVTCPVVVTFEEVPGGPTPGTNYDGVLVSLGLMFSERFVGQSVSPNGDSDVISGTPTNPLTPQPGAPGQNLDVFDYAGNVLTGLGPIGYPDIDAIGEGSVAIYYPAVQAKVRLSLVGGNGGTATLKFYRRDGSLVDEVVVSNAADQSYAFGTADSSYSISGILIENSDASGIGVDSICYDDMPTVIRSVTWGHLKRRYR